MSTLVVSASDAPFFPLLAGLVGSLRSHAKGRTQAMAVLDLGLEPAQRGWLAAHSVTCKAVGWDLEFPERERAPRHFKAMVARPFLPRHWPGYETYIWLDADCWVQQWWAIEGLEAMVDRFGFAIAAEHDRAYARTYGRSNAAQLFAQLLAQGFGDRARQTFADFPVLNSGVIGLRHDSPIWPQWQACLRAGLQSCRHYMIEQTALNVALYRQRSLPPSLPARYNWLAAECLPHIDPASGLLVEPFPPYGPIGILHLAGKIKSRGEVTLRTLEGDPLSTALSWPEIRKLSSGQTATAAPPSGGRVGRS